MAQRSTTATHKPRRNAKKPTGVVKPAAGEPRKCGYSLRTFDKFFWYTDADGIERKATSSSVSGQTLQQSNDYHFNPTTFKHFDYPRTFPEASTWPPRRLEDLLLPLGQFGEECVGSRCYTRPICKDEQCSHTLDQWKTATKDWQNHFELRKTEDHGIGVYTKRAFKKGDVLGWYAGELVDLGNTEFTNNYLMEMDIGNVRWEEPAWPTPPTSSNSSTTGDNIEQFVMNDAERIGNWTRFINHSCAPHCHFRIRRAGNIPIMAVEAIKAIPAGVEMTVHYGEEYWNIRSDMLCSCAAPKCISKRRRESEEEGRGKKRARKC